MLTLPVTQCTVEFQTAVLEAIHLLNHKNVFETGLFRASEY